MNVYERVHREREDHQTCIKSVWIGLSPSQHSLQQTSQTPRVELESKGHGEMKIEDCCLSPILWSKYICVN